eukprot:2583933-Rhodomonas_salina.1
MGPGADFEKAAISEGNHSQDGGRETVCSTGATVLTEFWRAFMGCSHRQDGMGWVWISSATMHCADLAAWITVRMGLGADFEITAISKGATARMEEEEL